MKGKLIVIAVLALLLCAMVPMTAAAAKDKTTIKENIYMSNYYDQWEDKVMVWLQEGRVGAITFDPDANTYSLSVHNLEPDWWYMIGVSQPSQSGYPYIGTMAPITWGDEPGRMPYYIQADGDGNIILDNEQFFFDWTTETNAAQYYANHGKFIVVGWPTSS